MAKSVQLRYFVDPALAPEINQMVWTLIYEKDSKTALMLKYLRENKEKPLKTISWLLDKECDIRVRPNTLQKMAVKCNIPYTE